MRAKIRLQEIANQIENVNVVADIGADHGYLTKMLIEQGRAKHVIATDISEPSLQKTEMLAKRFGFENKIEIRVGDGLDPIFKEDKVEVCVIAGMGGYEIIKILSSQDLKNIKIFVFQPAQNASNLREFLTQNGFEIVFDEIVKDQKKFYSTIRAIKNGTNKKLQKSQILFGISCQNTKNPDFFEYLKEYISKRQKLLSQKIETEKIKKELEIALELLNKN